jgi:hypothetical protein
VAHEWREHAMLKGRFGIDVHAAVHWVAVSPADAPPPAANRASFKDFNSAKRLRPGFFLTSL